MKSERALKRLIAFIIIYGVMYVITNVYLVVIHHTTDFASGEVPVLLRVIILLVEFIFLYPLLFQMQKYARQDGAKGFFVLAWCLMVLMTIGVVDSVIRYDIIGWLSDILAVAV